MTFSEVQSFVNKDIWETRMEEMYGKGNVDTIKNPAIPEEVVDVNKSEDTERKEDNYFSQRSNLDKIHKIEQAKQKTERPTPEEILAQLNMELPESRNSDANQSDITEWSSKTLEGKLA